jgi:hypothetical protein
MRTMNDFIVLALLAAVFSVTGGLLWLVDNL